MFIKRPRHLQYVQLLSAFSLNSLVCKFSEIPGLLFFTLTCMPCLLYFGEITLLESILHVSKMSRSSEGNRHVFFRVTVLRKP